MSIDTYKLATFEQAKLLNNTYPVGSPLRQGVCFSLVLEWTKNHMNKPTDTANKTIHWKPHFLNTNFGPRIYPTLRRTPLLNPVKRQ